MSIGDFFRSAAAGGGIFLAVVAFGLGLFSGEQVNPVDNIAKSGTGPIHDFCKNDFIADKVEVEGGHVQSLLCTKEDITVILNPDGTFNIAEVNGDFTTDPAEVPGWLE